MSEQQYQPRAFKLLPVVVKNLLIINGLFFLATLTLTKFNIDLTDILGLHYLGADKFKPYQFITYMFMHGDFWHVLFNMFALWMFGSALENYWGPKKFLIYYIICGLGAALTHYIILFFEIRPAMEVVNSIIAAPTELNIQAFLNSPNFHVVSTEIQNLRDQFISSYYTALAQHNASGATQLAIEFLSNYQREYLNAPVVIGASGAVFGILLAFGMSFPNSIIYVYFAIPLKAKYFVIIYGAIELWSGISNNPADNVAHFAHLGGMFFGLLVLLYWKFNKKKKVW